MYGNIMLMIITILFCVVFVLAGFIVWRFPPSYNGLGYRTAMSEKNPATWRFAQVYCGRTMFISFLPALVLSATAELIGFFADISDNDFTTLSVVVIAANVILLFVVIGMTEKALRERFDKNGDPR